MKYYILAIQPNPVFPQVDCLTQTDAHKLRNGKLPDFNPKLIFNLTKGATITDVLSQATISARGFLINSRFKNLLLNYKLIEHISYEAQIRGSKHRYFWLHLIGDLQQIEWLDYKNSTFYKTEFGFRSENIIVSSYEDFKSKLEEIGDMNTIDIEDIKVNKKFDKNLDLFILPLLSNSIFISEKLKSAIEVEKITGVTIDDAPIY